jgi:hypothetical protein
MRPSLHSTTIYFPTLHFTSLHCLFDDLLFTSPYLSLSKPINHAVYYKTFLTFQNASCSTHISFKGTRLFVQLNYSRSVSRDWKRELFIGYDKYLTSMFPVQLSSCLYITCSGQNVAINRLYRITNG